MRSFIQVDFKKAFKSLLVWVAVYSIEIAINSPLSASIYTGISGFDIGYTEQTVLIHQTNRRS